MALWFPEETAKFIIDDKLLILRKGKHNVRIVEFISEEEWEASGQTYPGQPYTGRVRMIKAKLKEELQEEALANNENLSEEELEERLQTKLKGEIQKLTVANNPDIEFPDKGGLQERAAERKRLMQERKREAVRGNTWEKRGKAKKP